MVRNNLENPEILPPSSDVTPETEGNIVPLSETNNFRDLYKALDFMEAQWDGQRSWTSNQTEDTINLLREMADKIKEKGESIRQLDPEMLKGIPDIPDLRDAVWRILVENSPE